jgi:hypothetical protein
MTEISDIAGREFDWFAVDRCGQVALFSTAGEGRVPDQVLAHLDIHDKVGASIEVTNWGTEKVWQSYAAKGLYVYDWDFRTQCYARIARPDESTAPGPVIAIGAMDRIPRLDIDFADAAVVRISL